jgi:hypothetical protein
MLDTKGIFRLIESVPSPKAAVFYIKWHRFIYTELITHYNIGLPILVFINIEIIKKGGLILWMIKLQLLWM